MWKLDFFLLPSQNYREIDNDEALAFGERVSDIKKTDNFLVPDAFYDAVDREGVSGAEYLYLDEQNDINSYLQEVISKQKSCRETYDIINEMEMKGYAPISEKDVVNINRELCVCSTKESYENKVVKNSDAIEIKRRYLAKSGTYEVFKKRVSACFPSLVFHDKAFLKIGTLGRFEEIGEELIRHLAALNDYGKRIYKENAGSEEKSLNALKSKCGIVCSGKGSKETVSYKRSMHFGKEDYIITFNSHTKFYNGNNDQRIYFSWGRKEINDHQLIIMSIGPHWEKIKES